MEPNPLAHQLSQVLNPTHLMRFIMINNFGNQYDVLILLHKMRRRPHAVTNTETEGVYHPAEAKLNIKGRLLGCSSPGHFEVDVSKFHTLKWKVSTAFIQFYM